MSLGPPPNGNGMAWIKFVLQALILPLLVWIGLIHSRVVAIESSRFTVRDGQEVYQALDEKVDAQWLREDLREIREEIAELRTLILERRE